MNKKSSHESSFAKFIPYLKSVDIVTKPMLNRIEYLLTLCKEMTTEEILDIFIEDYINKEGTREYEAVNFFSKNYLVSADHFLEKDDFTVAPITNRFISWRFRSIHFDFKKSTIKSRLRVDVKLFSDIMQIELKATGNNCSHLQNIINTYIKPNLI